MDSSRAGNLRSDRARLHGRSNDPLLLRSRPTSASLHRRDHFNLRLGHRSSPRITPSTCPNDSALQGGPHRVLTAEAKPQLALMDPTAAFLVEAKLQPVPMDPTAAFLVEAKLQPARMDLMEA